MTGYLWPIPKGTKQAACRSCNKPIYWVRNSGSSMPLEVLPAEDDHQLPTATKDGRGTSHFATCPHADAWRRRQGRDS
jgi:hypothetical protein